MNIKQKTSSLSSRRRGLTLLEVVAAIAILGGILVGLVLAKTRHARQAALARRQSQAVRLVDDLIASWWAQNPHGYHVPVGMTGALGDNRDWEWETRLVPNIPVETLGARVLRVQVRQRRSHEIHFSPSANAELIVDLILPKHQLKDTP